jgi:hypothetical protein
MSGSRLAPFALVLFAERSAVEALGNSFGTAVITVDEVFAVHALSPHLFNSVLAARNTLSASVYAALNFFVRCFD